MKEIGEKNTPTSIKQYIQMRKAELEGVIKNPSIDPNTKESARKRSKILDKYT